MERFRTILAVAFAGAMLCVACVAGASPPPCMLQQGLVWNWTSTSLVGQQLTVAAPSGGTLYAAVCGVTSRTDCAKQDAATSVCLIDGAQTTVIGEWNADSSIVPGTMGAAIIRMGSKTPCPLGQAGDTYSTEIQLMCSTRTQVDIDTYSEYGPCQMGLLYQSPLVCIPAPRPSVSCRWTDPAGGHFFDFSALQAGGDLVASSAAGDSYVLRLCDGVQSSVACSNLNVYAGACVKDASTGVIRDVGNWDWDWDWSYILSAAPQVGVQVTIRGDEICTLQDGQQIRSISTIQLVCDATTGPMTVTHDAASCKYTFTVPTPLSCPEARLPHAFRSIPADIDEETQ